MTKTNETLTQFDAPFITCHNYIANQITHCSQTTSLQN